MLLLLSCSQLICGPQTVRQGDECVPNLDVPVPGDETPVEVADDSGDTQDTATSSTILNVYLLAGQSNMDGFGYITGLPPALRLPQTDISLYWNGKPQALMAASTGGMAYMGPEVSFGRHLADSGQSVALVKHAVSGTDLATFWFPGEDSSDPRVGEGWAGFLSNLKAAKADLDASGQDWKWAGFVWMQGESDATVADWANGYEQNLQRLLRRVREETAEPDLPVVLGKIACEELCSYADTVRAAQQAVADADPLVEAVETLDLPRNVRDPWHYDGPSERVLGERFANVFLEEPQAAAPIAALQITGYQLNYDGDYTVGWTFHVQSPITLTDIGSFATDGYLYTGTEWGLWDENGTLLLRDHVPAWGELPTSLRDSFDYSAIHPLTLAPGDYVVGIQTWSWDADQYADAAVGSVGTGVAYTGAAYHAGAYLNYPENRVAGNASSMAFLGPNFLYVPE